MPETKWTDQQKKAIKSREEGILVNAAAGSGKTAVLSRRVAALIEEGKSIDRLLVVTFTRAAAAEMRKRIEKALTESYERTGDRRMLEQKLLAGTARICTIDSFFNSLLKENFQQAEISPDFSILDTAEEEAVTEECLEALIEEKYETFPPEFRTAIAFLGGEGNDDALKAALKKLHGILSGMPEPEKWRRTIQRQNADPEFWKNAACAYAGEVFGEIAAADRRLLESGRLPEKRIPIAERETRFAESALALAKAGDWDGLCREIGAFSFEKLYKVPSPPPEEWITFKAYHNLLKDFLGKNPNSFGEAFLISENEIAKETLRLAEGVEALFSLTEELAERISAEYEKRGRYSFNAIARKAKTLLAENYDPETGDYVPTKLAQTLADSFDEVLIDEYQDVDDLQDLLFRILGKNGKTLFVVGDVKQSIYGFRGSNPQNFIQKKNALHVINLNRNFRSKSGILEFVNFLFSHLFNPAITEIAYDEGERLTSGSDDIPSDADVEICQLDQADTERQARFCAEKIKRLIASGYTVFDKETKQNRRAEFSDFAILLRANQPAETFLNVFAKESVPLVSPEKPNFWKMSEVQTVLAMLKIVNNPYNDAAVFSVIFSEMFAFTADEIARLKQEDETGETPLVKLVENKAETDAKCADFTRLLRHFRMMSRNLPAYRLIWQILVRTEYLDKVSFLPSGSAKRENLLSLYAFARSHPSADSLLQFIRLAELSAQSARDSEKQEITGQAVRILTMHGSKGLEFPVCILPLLEKPSRNNDDPILFSKTFGLGLRIRDDGMTYQVNTLQRKLIAAAEAKKEAAEELRLYYVALTRARDRLILMYSPTKIFLKALPEQCTLFNENQTRSAFALTSDNSPIAYLLPVLARHPCAGAIAPENVVCFPPCGGFRFSFPQEEENHSLCPKSQKTDHPPFSLNESELRRRFTFRYPGKMTKIPAKVSVTELSKGFIPDPDSALLIPKEGIQKPAFLRDASLSGTERGTAMHTFLRFADFTKKPEEEISRLLRDDFLSEAQADALNRRALNAFFTGEVPKMVAAAEKVLREEGFVVRIPASFYPGAPEGSEGEILMQGAIDLLCFTGDEAIVVDYKTDRASPETLLEKYKMQLSLYCFAAEKMYGKTIKRACLWSFASGRLIDLPVGQIPGTLCKKTNS